MSIISKLTGSLPNPLELFQGTWEIQYKNKFVVEESKKGLTEEQKSVQTIGQKIKGFVENSINSKLADPWEKLPFDSIISVNEIEEANIVNQQIERGSFRSVNKIKKPKVFKVVAATGGISYGIEETLGILKELLPLSRKSVGQNLTTKDIGNIIGGFDIYTKKGASKETIGGVFDTTKKLLTQRLIPMEFRVITPHDTTEKLNLVKMDYTFRKESGRNMLIVDLTFQEILENSKTADQFQEEMVKMAGDARKTLGGLRQLAGV